MAVNETSALELVKARLTRLTGDTSLDFYLQPRIRATIVKLTMEGLRLDDSDRALMLVVDQAVWDYQNRDKPGPEPLWLRKEKLEYWLCLRQGEGGGT